VGPVSYPSIYGKSTLIAGTIHLNQIKDSCRYPQTTIIARLSRKPGIYITTHDLQQLVSHNEPIFHEILVMFLDILCTQTTAAYVDPSFSIALEQNGWGDTKHRFATRCRHAIDYPHLSDPVIALPFHINGNHWVAVCRRIIHGKVVFFYADNSVAGQLKKK
jgi:hypothetical protein